VLPAEVRSTLQPADPSISFFEKVVAFRARRVDEELQQPAPL